MYTYVYLCVVFSTLHLSSLGMPSRCQGLMHLLGLLLMMMQALQSMLIAAQPTSSPRLLLASGVKWRN